MTDNVSLRSAKVKFNISRGMDQTFTVDVKGDTLKEQIEKLEIYAQDAKENIESVGSLTVKSVQISLGENSFFDFGAIFR